MRSAETDARSTRLPATSPAHAVIESLCARGLHEHVSKRSSLDPDKRRGTNGGTDWFYCSVPAPGQGYGDLTYRRGSVPSTCPPALSDGDFRMVTSDSETTDESFDDFIAPGT